MEKEKDGASFEAKVAYKLRKLGIILKRWGKYLKDTPCRWGYHEFGLWKAGRWDWFRDCSNCSCSYYQSSSNPKMEDIDLASYRIYLEGRSKEPGEYGADARKKLIELDKLEIVT